jgi:hypothetical protein
MEANVVAIVPLKFWAEDVPVAGKPGEFTQEHWVKWVKKGSNGATTSEKITRLKRNREIWPVIERHYEAWAKGQEEPTTGTPLGQWPSISREMADHLKTLHLRTVEDVATATDADLDRMGMGARALREKARAYVKAKEGEAVVAEAMSGMKQENDSLKARLAEMEQQMAQLTANLPKRAKPKDIATEAA